MEKEQKKDIHYIMRAGIRVGYFNSYEDALYACNHSYKGGLIVSHREWEQRFK